MGSNFTARHNNQRATGKCIATFKRLTSYSRKHKLYQALREFGRIIKTRFLLNYIDDVVFRQQIEKQLNKIENVNRFSKRSSLVIVENIFMLIKRSKILQAILDSNSKLYYLLELSLLFKSLSKEKDLEQQQNSLKLLKMVQ